MNHANTRKVLLEKVMNTMVSSYATAQYEGKEIHFHFYRWKGWLMSKT